MVISIIQNGHPILRQTAKRVARQKITAPEIQTVIKNMADTLRKTANGIAIAAPQIAQSLRIFLVLERVWNPKLFDGAIKKNGHQKTHRESVAVFINPLITKKSGAFETLEEGCLSVEGVYGKTQRYPNVSVRAYDAKGKQFTRAATGLFAQVIQHEVDHLDGKLFIDHAIELYKLAAAE